MKSLAGQLLIASPHLPDDNFFRSVVLMVQHDENGALGLVLNRPTNLTVKRVWDEVGEGETHCEDPVYLGGPVQGPLMIVHTQMAQGELVITEGLYFASQKDFLSQVVVGDAGPFRLFTGYSGWGPGQLEGEMEAGAWLVRPATAEYVFSLTAEEIFRRVTDDLARDLMGRTLKLPRQPDDPSAN